ncbi:hypothetical protein SAMN04489761_4589 [Tenacibaculum sp. MAR_2009_124]|nr:hypothetical protein SAMN04489761_4589 [Tenacibaculum sp. MAR_2009_124]
MLDDLEIIGNILLLIDKISIFFLRTNIFLLLATLKIKNAISGRETCTYSRNFIRIIVKFVFLTR